MEEKDLKSLNIRTDLVTDIIPNINTTVNEETYEENNIRVSNIFLDSKSSKLIGKKKDKKSIWINAKTCEKTI